MTGDDLTTLPATPSAGRHGLASLVGVARDEFADRYWGRGPLSLRRPNA